MSDREDRSEMYKACNGELDLHMYSRDEVGSSFFQGHGMVSRWGWMQ